ncbi:MAG: hypothetical protein LBI30_02250 [Holosporales bacterium]|jgi:hypothetical protein|nr:hypothetical protein [Holosporales bacterium]
MLIKSNRFGVFVFGLAVGLLTESAAVCGARSLRVNADLIREINALRTAQSGSGAPVPLIRLTPDNRNVGDAQQDEIPDIVARTSTELTCDKLKLEVFERCLVGCVNLNDARDISDCIFVLHERLNDAHKGLFRTYILSAIYGGNDGAVALDAEGNPHRRLLPAMILGRYPDLAAELNGEANIETFDRLHHYISVLANRKDVFAARLRNQPRD